MPSAQTTYEALVEASGIGGRLARVDLGDDLGVGSALGLAALARLGAVVVVLSCDTARAMTVSSQAVRHAALHGASSWCRSLDELCDLVRPSRPGAEEALRLALSVDLLCVHGIGADAITPWRVADVLGRVVSIRRGDGLPTLLCTPLAAVGNLLEEAAEAGCDASQVASLASLMGHSVLLDGSRREGVCHGQDE